MGFLRGLLSISGHYSLQMSEYTEIRAGSGYIKYLFPSSGPFTILSHKSDDFSPDSSNSGTVIYNRLPDFFYYKEGYENKVIIII